MAWALISVYLYLCGASIEDEDPESQALYAQENIGTLPQTWDVKCNLFPFFRLQSDCGNAAHNVALF